MTRVSAGLTSGVGLEELADGVRRGGEAEGGGDADKGADAVVAIERGALRRFRFLVADTAVARGVARLLGGKYAVHRVAAFGVAAVADLLAQVCAYRRQQWVVEGQGQVLDHDLGRVAASAGAAGGDAADLVAPAMVHQAELVADVIDGVNDEIELREIELVDAAARDQVIDGRALTFGVDAEDALAQDIDLGLANGVVEGMDLAVGIADVDVVVIDQRDPPDSAACTSLGRPGTDAADTDDAEMRACELWQGGFAENPGEAFEATLIGWGQQETSRLLDEMRPMLTQTGCAVPIKIDARSRWQPARR